MENCKIFMPRPKPLVLVILDGWGYHAETKANAIPLARKPTYDRLLREYPNTLIHTSGPYVGLPDNQMGNSEVGHLNIGAGRIVHMDSTQIELMIRSGTYLASTRGGKNRPQLKLPLERGQSSVTLPCTLYST
jgi:2,3-bisphosphoglycerate-independent phosphoglycerate mutase